jgi:ZIP family zinc transporter
VPGELLTVVLVAGAAAAASVVGGLIALWRAPTTFFTSVALGFASGALLAAISFEMIPQALKLGSLWIAAAGFAVGFVAVYGFDLFIHRGQVAGEHAEQQEQVRRFYSWRRPRGSEVTVLAGATSAEELIEGVSIGTGAAIEPGLAIIIATAIAIDNVSESISIGELARDEKGGRPETRRVLGWTSLIGASLLVSAVAGWFLLRGLPEPILAFLLAVGAGAMLYLTVTDLIPGGEARQYQESSALATAAGFLMLMIVSNLT